MSTEIKFPVAASPIPDAVPEQPTEPHQPLQAIINEEQAQMLVNQLGELPTKMGFPILSLFLSIVNPQFQQQMITRGHLHAVDGMLEER